MTNPIKIENGIKYFDMPTYEINQVYLLHWTQHKKEIIKSGFLYTQLSRKSKNIVRIGCSRHYGRQIIYTPTEKNFVD
jgi:hypothetical protein